MGIIFILNLNFIRENMKTQVLGILMLVIGIASAQYEVADFEKNKIVFTDANFDAEIIKYDSIFIEFYNEL